MHRRCRRSIASRRLGQDVERIGGQAQIIDRGSAGLDGLLDVAGVAQRVE
jgi:hypothetical protein